MRQIYAYCRDGSCPVVDFLSETSEKIRKKFMFNLSYIVDEHNCLCEPYVKHFSIEKYRRLYELRVKIAGTMVRVIFYEKNGAVYLLHAFYKKDKKDTERALETALKILERITDGGGSVIEEYRKAVVI